MTFNKKLAILALIGLTLAACNFPLFKGAETETKLSDADLLATAVAGTVQAMSLPAQASETPQAPAAPTSAPALTAAPTNTVSAALPTSAATTQACNRAEFVTETIPDNTVLNLGESFTKTWTFKNTGSCTWNTNYKLVFASGDAMSGPASVNLTQSTAPGAALVVSVPLKAPAAAGTYTGYWSLQAEDGTIFFSGNSVSIKASSAAFQVSAVTTDLVDREPGSCSPYELNYTVSVTATAAGKVTFYTTNSIGDTSGTKTLTFSKAGTMEEELYWEINDSGSYWVKVYVDTPNHQWFGPFNFDITCP